MVYISKVYTKSGDGGQTMLASGDKVDKDDVRIEAYGCVDELNAAIGLVRLEIGREPGDEGRAFLETLDGQLGQIQQELFNLGAELATPKAVDGEAKLRVDDHHVQRLETELDAHNDALEPLRSFILPGGGPVGSATHLARTICRRAERRTVTLAKLDRVRPEAIRYLNRLSDYLFVIGRAAAKQLGYAEVLWNQEAT